jgi:hypothetical protein
MSMSVSKFSVSILLLFAFASSSALATHLEAAENSLPKALVSTVAEIQTLSEAESQAVTGDQEMELVAEIDRQADVVFKAFVASSGSRVPLSVLKKAQRLAVYRLKQMNALTDILKASGPVPAAAMVATEVLVDLILAPIATALGKPEIAGVMVAIPWGMLTGFSAFTYQATKIRSQIARSIGVRSLKSLDHLREIVIGYDLKYRVSSAVYKSLANDLGDVEFEILRKGWVPETSKLPALQIAELEKIVERSELGSEYLQAIYLERLDPASYAALLLRYINESEDLTSELVKLVRARMPAILASDDPRSLRRHLLGINDLQRQLERELKVLQTQRSGLKSRVKNGELTADEAKRLKLDAMKEIERLQDVRQILRRHEYSVLLEAEGQMAGDPSLSVRASLVPSSSVSELVEIAREARLRASKSGANAAAAPKVTIVDRVKSVVQELSARPLVCQDLFFRPLTL